MKHQCIVVKILMRVILLAILFIAGAQANTDLITHSDQSIHIQYPSTLETSQRQMAYEWLNNVADALLTVYGEWPKDNFYITIEQSTSRHSPVPWGQVSRGDTDNVLLVINPDSNLQEITNDWTAYHELSHLLIPYSGHGDMWFSEGLASYYQNIVQARAGLLSETGLWSKLASGFERGRKQNHLSHIKLVEISDNMRKYRNFMRVHWSGVHYWLTADIQLRRQSDNKITLDRMLKQLKTCCQHKSMSAAAIATQLDQLAGVDIFRRLFDDYRVSRMMPDYRPVLSGLGVALDHNNHEYGIALLSDAPNADIRRSIYKGGRQ